MSVTPSPKRQNVKVKIYDTDVLRYLYPEWDTLEKEEKFKLIQNTGKEALRKIKIHNVTCVGLHEYLTTCIDPEQDHTADGDEIAFGTDNSSFSSSDTSLNNEVGRVDVSDSSESSSTEIAFSSFVDSTELNGNTLAELGLYSNDGNLWNHAEISPTVDKTTSETIVAEIYIAFSN